MAEQDSVARVSEPPAGAPPEGDRAVAVLPPFSAIYRQYFDFVWSSARHLGIANEAIDDVVQEVFIVIHERLPTLQQPESLRSWIYGVVRRVASGHRRSHKLYQVRGAEVAQLAEPGVRTPTTPQQVAEQNAQVQLLQSLLSELDEPKREVFVLAELQEMSVPEIALALEIPVNTAYSRLRAARLAFEAGLARRAARAKEKGLR